MEMPKIFSVIPSVVKQEGVHLYAALFHQLVAKRVNRSQRVCFVVFGKIADVIPGVVMEESSIGMGTLTFQVGQEPAPQLPGSGDSDHGGIGHCLSALKR